MVCFVVVLLWGVLCLYDGNLGGLDVDCGFLVVQFDCFVGGEWYIFSFFCIFFQVCVLYQVFVDDVIVVQFFVGGFQVVGDVDCVVNDCEFQLMGWVNVVEDDWVEMNFY